MWRSTPPRAHIHTYTRERQTENTSLTRPSLQKIHHAADDTHDIPPPHHRGEGRRTHGKVSKHTERENTHFFWHHLLPFPPPPPPPPSFTSPPSAVSPKLCHDEARRSLRNQISRFFGNRGSGEEKSSPRQTVRSDTQRLRVCVGICVCMCVCDSSWREWAGRGEPGNLGGVPVNRQAGRGLQETDRLASFEPPHTYTV